MAEELTNPFEGETVTKSDVKAQITKEGVAITMVLLKYKRGKKGTIPHLELTEDGLKFVEELAGYGCTQEEIAGRMGVGVRTLTNTYNCKMFKEAYWRGQLTFRTSIRIEQRKIMRKGSARMAIFLGKVYLGQDDHAQPETPPISPLDKLADALKEYEDGEGE